jgi:hypothetical protein
MTSPVKPAKTITKGVGPRDKRPFSSFDDLAAWVVSLGRAADVDDVRRNQQTIWGDLLFTWYTQGQVACVFAQRLARDAADARWYSAVVEGDWSGEHITGLVDAAAMSGAEGLQVLFPCDGTVEDALEITQRLAKHPRWQCVDTGWLEGEGGDSLQVGVRWIAPDGNYESWVLGLAPFDTMPFTRRFVGAPFIALVLRPTPPEEDRAAVPVGVSGLPASHLAHMDDRLGADQAKRDKWMEGTRLAKRALISPEPMSRARAKVTFAFPAWVKDELSDVLLCP